MVKHTAANMKRTAHPSAEQLEQFVLGKLSAELSEGIEAHLYQCAACTALLGTLSPNDSFISLIQEKATEQTAPAIIHIDGYQILSELGRGGMGVVYKAMDLRLKRLVALKVILQGEYADHAHRERLRLEAETIATLQHPGIVQIYEIGEYQGHLYLALELLNPNGLQSMMRNAPHCCTWSAALIHQLAEIISYSHQRGIIHRDLKPENILFNPTPDEALPRVSQFKSLKNALPVVKITDFGLAKCVSADNQMTKTGFIIGTPHYMSPEQIPDSEESVGFASDIYALGVLLYQLLTGRLPFAAGNVLQVLKMLRHDEPIAPRQINPRIARDLETICLKCLMKKPADRYGSAQALADDLALFLHDEPIRAKPLTGWQYMVKWARQKPVLAGSYIVIACMYSLHLLAMGVLNLPRHQGLFHSVLTFSAIVGAAALYPIQTMLGSEKWQHLGQYSFMSLTIITLTIILALDGAAQSVPINVYMYLIMGAPLLSARPQLIGFQTLLSILGYVSLLGFAQWFRPDLQVSIEAAVFFVLNLVFTGILTYLLARRISSIQ